MAAPSTIAVLGFLPWSDPARDTKVTVNPAAAAADLCARTLTAEGIPAAFVPIPVSGEGISTALEMVRRLGSEIIVAAGQTTTGPRVERFGRAPGVWAPAEVSEASPWEIAPDAQALAEALNAVTDPSAQVDPFIVSKDAGAYFCDHLCVELVRESRRRPLRTRFLHVTAVDACPPAVRNARIRLYARQLRVAVDWLRQLPSPLA